MVRTALCVRQCVLARLAASPKHTDGGFAATDHTRSKAEFVQHQPVADKPPSGQLDWCRWVGCKQGGGCCSTCPVKDRSDRSSAIMRGKCVCIPTERSGGSRAEALFAAMLVTPAVPRQLSYAWRLPAAIQRSSLHCWHSATALVIMKRQGLSPSGRLKPKPSVDHAGWAREVSH